MSTYDPLLLCQVATPKPRGKSRYYTMRVNEVTFLRCRDNNVVKLLRSVLPRLPQGAHVRISNKIDTRSPR